MPRVTETRTQNGDFADFIKEAADPSRLIEVQAAASVDGQVYTRLFERHPAHEAAGYDRGEVFILSGQRAKVAHTPGVEEKIRREEARVRGQNELAASSLDSQFEQLEDLGEQAEIDARLAALKGGSSSPAEIGAGSSGTGVSEDDLAALETERDRA